MNPVDGLEEQRAVVGPVEVDGIVAGAMKGNRLRARRRICHEHSCTRVKEALNDQLSRILLARTFATLVQIIMESVRASWYTTVDLKARHSQPLANEFSKIIEIRDEVAPA